MAENIGKVVVSIEAEVKELRAGLERAEGMFKKSSERMVAQQKGLASKIGRSWTELSSKISVITLALDVVSKSINVLKDSFVILGDSTKSAGQKFAGVMGAVEEAQIPLLSQVISLTQETEDWLDGSTAKAEVWNNVTRETLRLHQALDAFLQLEHYKKTLEEILSDEKKRTELMTETMNHEVEKMKLTEDIMRRKFDDELKAMHMVDKESTEDFEKRKQQARELQDEIIAEMYRQARFADDQRNQAWWKGVLAKRAELEEIAAMEEKARKDKQDADDKAAERVASKTMSLQEKLAIMIAKKAGQTAEAEVIAIQSKYRKMLEGATGYDQIKLIEMMQRMELEGVGAGGAGGGGTASVSTAIGGFTVAGAASEPKKQTSLLEKIAESNEGVLDALRKARTLGDIVAPS